MGIPDSAFVRFRAVAERYRQLTATENDIRARLAAAVRARRELQKERERAAQLRYAAGGGIGGRLLQLDNSEALAELDRRIKATEAAIASLTTEAERVEARKSGAGDLLSRCGDLLRDLGAGRDQLEY